MSTGANAEQDPGLIAVVGATGFTGRLVAEEVRRRGLRVRLVGRNPQRLEAVARDLGGGDGEVGVAAVTSWDRRSLAAALDGVAAAVSCAGPFTVAGRPVVEAAVEAGAHYTDSTGEQPFIRDVYEQLDRPATRAGVALVPACGFDYMPGDLGAAIVAEDLEPLESIEVVYAVERPDTSAGTRKSAIGIMGGPCLQHVDGRLRAERLGARRRTVSTPFGRRTAGSVPGGEALMVPRHLRVDTVIGYLSVPGALSPASPAAAAVPLLLRLPGVARALDRAAGRGPAGPDAQAREARAVCVIQATARSGRRRAIRIDGRDPYGLTALSLAELAERMARGRIDATGARSPAEVVEPRGFLEAVGLRVVEVDPE